ncbi:MAG: alpha/beta fold hydrolase [Ruminococcaceae bacterium]|nr:alpha/beta fold hydrolase [Oscillospiraceae bacterium]
MQLINYEDTLRVSKNALRQNRFSPWTDRIWVESSVTPGVFFAVQVRKPARPGRIIATTHGWHMSIPAFDPAAGPSEDGYLWVHVDMRGRACSDGAPDCNGLELIDVYDAVEYVKVHYADFLADDVVYFEGGSGGGGNAFAIATKFPDYFSAVTGLCGISDYAEWYRNDAVGEFRDEMDIWVGCTPVDNPMAYDARSGAPCVSNLMVPFFTAHGSTDERVPVWHARHFVECAAEAGKAALVAYFELENVGTQSHWGRATKEMLDEMAERSEANRRKAQTVPVLPEKGSLWVPGYLYTRRFIVRLDSVDKLARLDYDLTTNTFSLHCDKPCRFSIELL